MKTTIIQTSLHWENREKNIAHFDNLISSIKERTNLIILPEMFTTGFSMNPEKVSEPSNGGTLKWLKQKAKEKNCVITGSVAVEEKGNYYNRLFWVNESGEYKTYDKRHLFRMAKEDTHYTAGSKKLIAKINDWNICPLVCYDLRFPVWSRNRFDLKGESRQSAVGSEQSGVGSWEYDVLIYVANWPEVRNYPWKQLLIARAIENQCYVIGVNRIGKDGNDFSHSGDSVVINPRGEIISVTKANEESIETVFLDKNYLEEFRTIFPVGLDSDFFELK
ncbi:nitrilase family protein [Aurantibacillus circumpalustris]|uniref:nitrilase family protein n=1 Tax=Aurantibacillus circumpalustris TaxID=3036359 RepID=UPI00295AD25F|nr:nitrilase family protein [Aurantibacillus circumpalustris]